MGKDMDALRGMALATRAKVLAEQDGQRQKSAAPVIPGVKLAGAAPGGRIRSAVTDVGRARRGLVAHMVRNLKPETLAKLTPGQRSALDSFRKWDGGR
jgi:hypothetical protein